MAVITTSKFPLDQPTIVLKISWKGIENPERGKVYYLYDSTTITTTIVKDVSCFIRNLDRSMIEIFQELDVAVPFLSRLPPGSRDKPYIEMHLRDKVCKAVNSCGSGGFTLEFGIAVAFGSDVDQYPFTITNEKPVLATEATDTDPSYSPLNQQPRLTTMLLTMLPTDTDSSCCPICLDRLFGEGLSVEWLLCAHAFHLGCIESWFEWARNCPICRDLV